MGKDNVWVEKGAQSSVPQAGLRCWDVGPCRSCLSFCSLLCGESCPDTSEARFPPLHPNASPSLGKVAVATGIKLDKDLGDLVQPSSVTVKSQGSEKTSQVSDASLEALGKKQG